MKMYLKSHQYFYFPDILAKFKNQKKITVCWTIQLGVSALLFSSIYLSISFAILV
jgi:hypothetical protein